MQFFNYIVWIDPKHSLGLRSGSDHVSNHEFYPIRVNNLHAVTTKNIRTYPYFPMRLLSFLPLLASTIYLHIKFLYPYDEILLNDTKFHTD